ncbi:MAG TPA: CaiB/BaiF CoA-transferase family protein [Thermoanaerobaculia bacterium]|nr:CaiB/BaiF CoA-transferase family protein [Thermoanaerobaculia bacterium]
MPETDDDLGRSDPPTLSGMLVLDLSRLLPGAVLARQLADLGARVVKVEEPGVGDPLRLVPPQVEGVGIAFAALLAGVESVVLDLRRTTDAARLRRLVLEADVLVESFRPGTLESWGLGLDELTAANPRLVACSLPAWPGDGPRAARVAHDLNLTAETGALELLGGGVPALQLADVGAGLLAATAVAAALLRRERTGRGARIVQPLACGVLPFLTWALAEAGLGRERVLATLLGGGVPCYRRYAAGDGRELTVAALEPKFWAALVEALELPELAGAGLAFGPAGEGVVDAVQARLAAAPCDHWTELAAALGLPLAAVRTLEEAAADPALSAAGATAALPLPGGGATVTSGPWIPSLSLPSGRPAPRLGEHTDSILGELLGPP